MRVEGLVEDGQSRGGTLRTERQYRTLLKPLLYKLHNVKTISPDCRSNGLGLNSCLTDTTIRKQGRLSLAAG